MDEKIKAMSTIDCPHCQGEIIVVLDVAPPVVKSVLYREFIDKAKEQLKGYVRSQGFDEDFVIGVMSWIEADTTIFGLDEVDEMLLSIKNSYQDYDSTKVDNS
jgi:hypothetical protein